MLIGTLRRRSTSTPPRKPPAIAPQIPSPAAPDVERLDRMAARPEVRVRRGNDVIQPGADDAERHGDDSDVTGQAGRCSPRAKPALGEDDPDDHPESDAEGVTP